jgi:glycerol-3-phosphate dehydrogenase (NAD(P)+)
MNKTICVLGEGAWGTAVATLLAANGYTVNLWCYEPEVAQEIKRSRYNKKYLPDIKLDPKIQPTIDFAHATCDVQFVFEAIPVKYLREVLQQAQSCYTPEQVWVVLSKGIEQDSLLLPTQILDNVFGDEVQTAVFSGPSFAKEVANKEITAVTIAATECNLAEDLLGMLANDFFRPYATHDVIGVQVGGALKNVITIGIGLLDGAGYTENTKAFLLTKGLQEMKELATVLGGDPDTLDGLSGVGDLVLTAMGDASRNLQLGRKIGGGMPREQAVESLGHVAEGANTVQSVYQLMQKHNLDLVICRNVYEVLFEDKSVDAMLEDLMAQPLEMECAGE